MIDPRSRSLEWIEQAKQQIPGVSDTPLVEKAIRALSLLESLIQTGTNEVKHYRPEMDTKLTAIPPTSDTHALPSPPGSRPG